MVLDANEQMRKKSSKVTAKLRTMRTERVKEIRKSFTNTFFPTKKVLCNFLLFVAAECVSFPVVGVVGCTKSSRVRICRFKNNSLGVAFVEAWST